jgi:ATP-dependent helicase/nuclease subunit B
MAEIGWIYPDRRRLASHPWRAIAACIRDCADARRQPLRDCFVLVPFAQLLGPARRAFGAQGGWMPRVETTRTLAESLGPGVSPGAGQPTFDLALDTLTIQHLLGRQSWGRAWRARDPAGFALGVSQVARTAHTFARACFALNPTARAAFWQRIREALTPADGPGAHERRLARIAAEWASLATSPATDRLFSMRPAGWFIVQAGAPDALVGNLLEAADADTLCAVIDTDLRGANDSEPTTPDADPTSIICNEFEDEAQTTAARVIEHLRRGEQPVALIAHDRVLVRRVRALLDRQGISIADETGWKLSTTRAAARVMTLLRAAQPNASSDDLLDWLKSDVRWLELGDPRIPIRRLEALCRRSNIARVSGLPVTELSSSVQALFACAVSTLDQFRIHQRASLAGWAAALAAALRQCGALDALARDDAGRQVLSALRLCASDVESDIARGIAGDEPLTFLEFVHWVDAAMESRNFLPSAQGPDGAQVVITPLAQTMLRPFEAVIFPGADDSRLGAPPAPHPLLTDAQAQALGVPSAAQQRSAERSAFGQLLQFKRLTFLMRRREGNQPLENSPLVEQLAIALRRSGRSLAEWSDPRPVLDIEPCSIQRGAPQAADLLPSRISASTYEALRDCPYRFFAKGVLRLREPDELERDLEKRDYGNWLHAVLFRFHSTRERPESAPTEEARLAAVARACLVEAGLDASEFLPFAMSFKALTPRYIEWLHQRDRRGLRWLHGEHELEVTLGEPGDLVLEGHVDRIDRIGEGGFSGTELIDYKTGNSDALKRRVKQPLEDTQLAFYAALLPNDLQSSLRAAYVALDSSKGIEFIEHKEVTRSAGILEWEIASEYARLRGGAGMPALGEGEICERCEARGLCRRDHWLNPTGNTA